MAKVIVELENIKRLREAALKVQAQAYAPYSKYMVGASVLTARCNVYAGCNVECADYDGTHAEEAALCAMVAAGERNPVIVLVFGGFAGEEPRIVMPCGKCRQKLYEFVSLMGADLSIVRSLSPLSYAALGADLLPNAFGPADVGVNLAQYRH